MSAILIENGTMLGAISEQVKLPGKEFVIPEIVISASYSSNSLNRSNTNESQPPPSTPLPNHVDTVTAVESTALLEEEDDDNDDEGHHQDADADFDQFILNRTTSESNMLDSSIYSELQFTPSVAGPQTPSSMGGIINGTTIPIQLTVQPPIATPSTVTAVVDVLNTSACSRSESRQAKRMRRKSHKSKTKCNASNGIGVGVGVGVGVGIGGAGAVDNTTTTASGVTAPVGVPSATANYPPQYTAIFLDAHHHGNAAAAAAAVANAAIAGQLATAAASSPFLNHGTVSVSGETANYLQYHHQHHQYYQQRPMIGNTTHHHLHHTRRALVDVAVPLTGGGGSTTVSADGITNLATSNSIVNGGNGGTTSEVVSAPLAYSLRKWFARPSLPFVIGILALGGVACTLGGIVLGSTGLIEHSTQYLSAALLMIGIGVSLLVISGAIWRLSLPDDVDDCPCFRMETCRTCNSPHCNSRLLPGSYLYPEFQHRPPPPSYLTSLNEYAFVYHPNAHQAAYTAVRVNTPPPLYRSTYSLNSSITQGQAAIVTFPGSNEPSVVQPMPQTPDELNSIVFTREAMSQTSLKDTTISISCETEGQTLYKELELD